MILNAKVRRPWKAFRERRKKKKFWQVALDKASDERKLRRKIPRHKTGFRERSFEIRRPVGFTNYFLNWRFEPRLKIHNKYRERTVQRFEDIFRDWRLHRLMVEAPEYDYALRDFYPHKRHKGLQGPNAIRGTGCSGS